MNARSPRTPSYRLHKPTGQAVVTLTGADVYLGKYGTPESRSAYDRTIAEWLANGRANPKTTDPTINELIVRYLRSLDGNYASNEPANIRIALKPLRSLYGPTQAAEFGPLKLKAVRRSFIDADLCRNEVNRRTRRIVRMFKWAVAEELITANILHALKAVEGVKRGREGVRESAPVKPIADAHVDALRLHVARQVWAMIELQRLTGSRPGEVVIMRGCDLNMAGSVWEYRPGAHKTQHHGKDRIIFIGPLAQEVLRDWLRADLGEYLFQPREAEAERKAGMRAARKTKVWPSHAAHQARKRKAKPRKTPGERYAADSYRKAIEYGIERTNKAHTLNGSPPVPHWHPHQLRHNAATRLRREFGLDTARAVLGHSSASVTEGYAEMEMSKASEAMRKMG